MVAIYVPILQPAEQVYLHVPNAFLLDHKIAYMLRALHACNKSKDNKITCLGTAVTYHRRCRNPLRTAKWMAVLAEMIAAAEDSYVLLGDLKFMALEWALGLSCYLHGAQKGVAMAALGAVVVYRLESKGGTVVPGLLDLWECALDPGLWSCCAEGHAAPETQEKEAKCVVENVDESDAVSEGLLETLKSPAKNLGESGILSAPSLGKIETKQAKLSHLLDKMLLSFMKAVLRFCLSILLLHLGVLLLRESISLLLRNK